MMADEFLPTVGAKDFWLPAQFKQPFKVARELDGGNAKVSFCDQTLAVEIVNHIEPAHGATIGELDVYEVDGEHLVLFIRRYQWRWCG